MLVLLYINVCIFFHRMICGRRVRVEPSSGTRTGRFGGFGPPSRGSRNRPFHPEDRCYECGDRGHYARDCSRFRRGSRRYAIFLMFILGFFSLSSSISVNSSEFTKVFFFFLTVFATYYLNGCLFDLSVLDELFSVCILKGGAVAVCIAFMGLAKRHFLMQCQITFFHCYCLKKY